MMKKTTISFIFIICTHLFAQVEESSSFSEFQISSERYLTDENGNIMMNVNIWGQVGTPGNHRVYEGIDLATLLSFVGGPQSGANLKKAKLYREVPDENGQIVYHIDLNDFYQTGDRSNFIKVKPNDTIIIPQKPFSYFLTQVGTVNTMLSLINLYFQVAQK